jgi:hypothetical protein
MDIESRRRTEQVNMAGETLVFKKVKSGGSREESGSRSLFGALAGTIRIGSGANLVGPTGERWNAERG